MHVRREQVGPRKPFKTTLRTALHGHIGGAPLRDLVVPDGVVKLMAFNGIVRLSQDGIPFGNQRDVAEVLQPVRHPDCSGQSTGHRMSGAVLVDEVLGEVHQSAALRVGRQPSFDRALDLTAQRLILSQLTPEDFWETSAQVQRIESLRKPLIAQRAEVDQLSTNALQELQILLVVEMECPVVGDADSHET